VGGGADVPVLLPRDWPDPQAASTVARATIPRPAVRPEAVGAVRRLTTEARRRRRSGGRENVGSMRAAVYQALTD